MAQGKYKNGVAIETTYQAVNNATGKTVTMDVYDEAHAKDVAKCIGAMTEIVATGRYYASFTPDAEGIWTVVMLNTTDSNGPVVKQYAVAGHDVDSIGDAIAGQNDLSAADVAGELATYDGPTKAEMDTGHGLLATPAEVATALDTYDGPTDAEMDAGFAGLNDLSPAEVATALDTYDGPTDTEMDAAIAAHETAVRGADSDTLKTLSDQIDSVSAPAMVG